MPEHAEITRWGFVTIQACVPASWEHDQIEAFANKNYPTGIQSNWVVKPAEECHDPQRVACEDHKANIHILLQC